MLSNEEILDTPLDLLPRDLNTIGKYIWETMREMGIPEACYEIEDAFCDAIRKLIEESK